MFLSGFLVVLEICSEFVRRNEGTQNKVSDFASCFACSLVFLVVFEFFIYWLVRWPLQQHHITHTSKENC